MAEGVGHRAGVVPASVAAGGHRRPAWDAASATGAAMLWRAPTQLALPVVRVLDEDHRPHPGPRRRTGRQLPPAMRAGTANDQLNTHLRGPGRVLRSRLPNLVRQEM
ncbi:MAG: hypothetical protein ACRDTT_09190 [Pseudonocardiaceae bacterium]